MSWLTLNGINVGSIAASGSDVAGERRDIGETSPAASGALRMTRQARKRDLKFETVPLLAATARAWEGLIGGEGHVWSFDSHVYSSKGLGPSTLGGLVVDTGVKKYGAASGKLAISAAAAIFSNVWLTGSKYALSYWFSTGGAFTYYVEDWAGGVWVNGVPGASSGSFAFTATGFQLNSSGSTARYWDDIVAVPYIMPSDWPAQLYAMGGAPLGPQAFSALPKLTAAGLVVAEAASRTVLGSTSEQVLMGKKSGALQPDLRKLSVELREA